jgi:hypothetical protein
MAVRDTLRMTVLGNPEADTPFVPFHATAALQSLAERWEAVHPGASFIPETAFSQAEEDYQMGREEL